MTRKQQRDRVRLALQFLGGRIEMPNLEECALLGYDPYALRERGSPSCIDLRERAVEILAEAIVPDSGEGDS